jgi:hypothetical protein
MTKRPHGSENKPAWQPPKGDNPAEWGAYLESLAHDARSWDSLVRRLSGAGDDSSKRNGRRLACRANKTQVMIEVRDWQAFWLSSVERRPLPQVAQDLGITVREVEAARERVIGRLLGDGGSFRPFET